MDQQHGEWNVDDEPHTMKAKRLIAGFLASTLLSFGQPAQKGEEPSGVFMTFAPNESTATRDPRRLEATLNAKECRPAQNDPEGNWGDPIAGFQLGLRSEKSIYYVGDPIQVDAYLRNVSGAPLEYQIARGKGFGLCRFLMTYGAGDWLERIDERRIFSARSQTLHPFTQWKWPVRLNEMFRMDDPGEYFVTALSGVGEPSADIRSGNLMIRVIKKDAAAPPDNLTQTPASTNTNSSRASAVIRTSTQASENDTVSREPISASSKTVFPSPSVAPPPARPTSSDIASSSFTRERKIGTAILAGLTLLLLAILWRAVRRKPEA